MPRNPYVRNREFLDLPPCGSRADPSITETRFSTHYGKTSSWVGSTLAGPSSRTVPVHRIRDRLLSCNVCSFQDPRGSRAISSIPAYRAAWAFPALLTTREIRQYSVLIVKFGQEDE